MTKTPFSRYNWHFDKVIDESNDTTDTAQLLIFICGLVA